MHQLLWAVAAHHLRRAVKAVEMYLAGMRGIGIVLSHPLHKLSIGIQMSTAVAESFLLDLIV